MAAGNQMANRVGAEPLKQNSAIPNMQPTYPHGLQRGGPPSIKATTKAPGGITIDG